MDTMWGFVADLANRMLDDLAGRLTEPMKFRLVLQPVMAIILAARAGLEDARTGRKPYLWAIFTTPGHTRELLRQGWKDVGRVFALAVLLDVVYQLVVLRWVYPGETLAVAALLAFVPYLLVRGTLTRLARRHAAPAQEIERGTA